MHPLNEQHFEILGNLLYFMAVTLLKTLKQITIFEAIIYIKNKLL